MTNTLLARVLDTANIDSTVRPQDDFYRHVNGTWLATHTIPADRPMDGAFHTLRDASEKYARAIAQDAADGTLDDPDAHRIATLWTQFLNEDTIEEAGAAPLRPDLDAINACTTHEELAREMGRLMREGIGGLIGAYVGTDPHDSSRYMVSLVQSGIGLPDEAYYREDDYAPIREAYVAHTARLLGLAGVADHEAAATRIMELETALASHHRDSVSNRDPLLSDNPTPWEEIAALAPGFDWDAWAQGARMPVAGLVVNVDQPDFLSAAAALWADTDLSPLKEWLSASAIDCHASLLSALQPNAMAFNGVPFQYKAHPIQIKTNERVRVWVMDAGPNLATTFHVVGTQFDTVWREGAYVIRGGGSGGGWGQVLTLGAAEGGFVEFTPLEAGHYAFVNHALSLAEKGQLGVFEVTD